ncbi:MAG: hypothetical protein UT24_C0002G0040 [Candidatus Woesebacteria bacterium GW2011_GWB1_39_12]|uniref:Bacterial sugar transferase domain-containing protein n=2 Tax=Candidatus Woeseibacteriota TaxID=1752722 RepID=A0A0G0Q6K2_9BACT|nr:MAG: hypothetical protein UT23_C0014G0027 [Candidatus Woesebacteria bacterium GW2011_GWA1_39_12]KKR01777.1 MAG: hypothetical protein UT24_C0002G0040 [Candidatus Woesebacteria bacterium GW2011_GWB1_39_12]
MANPEVLSNPISHLDQIDGYLRRGDTEIARILNNMCPPKGDKYINSDWKKALDYAIGVPSSVLATPFIIGLATAKLIEDGSEPFFVHMRASKIGDYAINDLPVWKIRCMKPNSDKGSRVNSDIAGGLTPDNDPRNTALGSFMRKFQLEELPQLYQVVLGKMSFFGIRAIPLDEARELENKWSSERYRRWVEAYNSGKTGVSGLSQTIGSPLKWVQDNYHLDMFYYENASLGLDMYLIWRTAIRLAKIK